MGRQELEQEIRKRLYKSDNTKTNTIDDDICQGCGESLSDPLVNYVPEHGGDTEHRVTYCDKQCKSEHIEEMFNREQ